jgi:hypothetical protein
MFIVGNMWKFAAVLSQKYSLLFNCLFRIIKVCLLSVACGSLLRYSVKGTCYYSIVCLG